MQAVKNQAESNLAKNMNMINKDFYLYVEKKQDKRKNIYGPNLKQMPHLSLKRRMWNKGRHTEVV